jgi:hypothetical protein
MFLVSNSKIVKTLLDQAVIHFGIPRQNASQPVVPQRHAFLRFPDQQPGCQPRFAPGPVGVIIPIFHGITLPERQRLLNGDLKRPFPLWIRCVDGAARKRDDPPMNIARIEEAVQRGVPFRLKVADGDEYRVPHPDYVSLPPRSSAKRTYIIVHNDEGFASVLPMLTITSLTFQMDANT